MTLEPLKIKRALLSVSDKTRLLELARALADRQIEIISTGGTAKALLEAGIEVSDVSEITGFPEMMDGRLKTLHPKVHGGLLAVRGNADHLAAQERHEITDIDLLVVNLYPFEETVKGGGAFDTCIENIDIGGPAMIRAAVKNHTGVLVLVEPSDYDDFLGELETCDGATRLAFRRRLAAKAIARTACYDAAIANWFASEEQENTSDFRCFGGTLAQTLRYGENPHQWAAFYQSGEQRPGVASAAQLQGKALSYNNFNDTDAAFELISEFDPQKRSVVAIIKHANPCGVALGTTTIEAYRKALKCDPVSAFGGIVALNATLEKETAEEIVKLFTEVIIAPHASDEAIEIIAAKKNLRLLVTGGLPDPKACGILVRTLAGGLLVQSRDNGSVEEPDLKVVTARAPSDQEWADLKFAFKVCKHVKSNAIVYAKNGATVGIGAGQMSRIDATHIAARKSADAAHAAGDEESLTAKSVVASDAFFPFADGLLAAARAGATAIIQPGGSMRDAEVIEAANDKGLAMVFTAMRHFRH